VNIKLMKKLDAVIGFMAVSTFPTPLCRELAFPLDSLLLIRPGGIGDAVLLGPAIRSLKANNPSIHVTVLAEKRNAGIFLLIPGVDRLLRYDRPGELLQALRSRYDAVIDTEQWYRLSAVVARIASAPVKIGFDTNERQRMFTHPIPYSHDAYEVFSFTRLLEPLGIEVGAVEYGVPFLSLPDAVSDKIAALLESLRDQPFVVVFPGASIPERRWDADRFRQVAERLSAFGIKVVIVGGNECRQQGDEIAGGGLGLNLAGLTSLAETAAIIQKSSLLVSGDSGVLHIAVGLGTPTVSLFGPGRAKKWAPKGHQDIVINKELSCSPCTTFGRTPSCPSNAQCMRDISVDDVVNAVTMAVILSPS
jgi:lipopolysaccharide heptosyltransferase II